MPKSFLKGIDRSGLARGLFHNLRFDEEGNIRPDFVLNRTDMHGTRMLIVGPNFGCGSSREHAVWGMLQFGIRAIIGTSFAGIFADNAANNGLLLVTLPEGQIATLMAYVERELTDITVDLERRVIKAETLELSFEISELRRRALMLGLDRIGETLTHASAIQAFQKKHLAAQPWL